MKAQDQVYRILQQHLDRQPVGFPATWSRADLRFLRRMFTPEEARLARHLTYQPAATAAIVARATPEFDAATVGRLLDSLFRKGSIGWKHADGTDQWCVLPMVIGMYEAQDGDPSPEFLADAEAYTKTLAYGASFLATSPSQMRTIPIEQSIPATHPVASYDEIRAIVADARGPFAVLPCICRRRKELKGEPCGVTQRLETCLTFGDMAATLRRRGHGREITREETLAILRQNEDEGLVLQPANARHPEFVCSCCGCCCGMLGVQKSLPHPADFWTTSHRAEIDAALCQHCGKCVRRCQVNAITLPRRKRPARLNPSRCIGCGLCVTTCPSHALRLSPRAEAPVPPESIEALQDVIAARKKSPWARRRMMAKVMLGMRQ